MITDPLLMGYCFRCYGSSNNNNNNFESSGGGSMFHKILITTKQSIQYIDAGYVQEV